MSRSLLLSGLKEGVTDEEEGVKSQELILLLCWCCCCITIAIDFIIVLIGDDDDEEEVAMEEELVMDAAFAGNRENASESASREARFAPRRNIFNLPCFSINNINRVGGAWGMNVREVLLCVLTIFRKKFYSSKLLNLCFKMMRFNCLCSRVQYRF